jgi:UDP-N-acetylmuramate dehydrogenase
VGGPADHWIVATSEAALVDAVRACDQAGTPVLILGGGSNLLVADAGFRGTVIQVATRGLRETVGPGGPVIMAAAGEPWDALVDRAVQAGWSGIEALAGIPGLCGATPVQNVGAYGQDVGEVIVSVRALDRHAGSIRELTHDECGFGYRTSIFKKEPDRWVALATTMLLRADADSDVRYAELARVLGVDVGDRVEVARVRDAVIHLRRSKAMVLDGAEPDSHSAGSFFTNPIIDQRTADRIPGCPQYPAVDGVKLSAAWLIEHSGISRGWQVRVDSPARVSTRHTLALTNTGGASADDVLELARAIRDRVERAFGITLQPEPRLVNCAL